MDKQVQESLLEIKFTISTLEQQIKYLNHLSAENGYNDEVIEQRISLVTNKLVELEHTVKRIEFQVEDIEQNSPTTKIDEELDSDDEQEKSGLTWKMTVTIIIAIISFLSGPIIEIIRYLLK